jgi:6-phosphogluconolactonase
MTPRSVAPLLLLVAMACANTQPAARPGPGTDQVPFVYVAGYRPEILIFRLDLGSGKLTPAGSTTSGAAPSFLAWDPSAHFLFALDEVAEGRVNAFAIDRRSGALSAINGASSAGVGPAHLSVDRTGRFLLVANYADQKPGTIGVLPIGPDGRLGEPVDSRDFGPGSMPHMITVDPTNHFVFVPSKGGGYVAQLKLDLGSGKLAPNDPDRVATAAGAGPRHITFHPNGRNAYVINEQGFTITGYGFDPASGRLTPQQTVPTLPPDVGNTTGFSTADIHVHPSGKFLYGSNRGYNSIVIFRLDDAGRMTLVGHERRGINFPRNFHVDPTGTLLLVANQRADTVAVFRIDQSAGTLEPAGEPVPAGKGPSFVGVVMLPGR